MTFPLVLLQRLLLRAGATYVTVNGKAARTRRCRWARWSWPAFALIVLWLFVTVIVPLSGIALRSFVTNWGEGVNSPKC